MEYRLSLENQIKDQNEQKLKNIGMSEYERKVNANEIEAYENMSPVVHSKIVSIADPENCRLFDPRRLSKNLPSQNVIIYDASKSKEYIEGMHSLVPNDRYSGVNPSHRGNSNLAEIVSKSLNDQNMIRYKQGNNDYSTGNQPRYNVERRRDITPAPQSKPIGYENLRPELNSRYFHYIIISFDPYKQVESNSISKPKLRRYSRLKNTPDVTKMRAAGGIRKQAINYNIISGIDN